MKIMDCVEVIVEKNKYAKDGVHKGMQGWICLNDCANGTWLVNFPQCGEKDDIAEISIEEDDLMQIPVMHADMNERIRAQFDALEKEEKAEDVSDYMI